jgi:hypothetical protein
MGEVWGSGLCTDASLRCAGWDCGAWQGSSENATQASPPVSQQTGGENRPCGPEDGPACEKATLSGVVRKRGRRLGRRGNALLLALRGGALELWAIAPGQTAEARAAPGAAVRTTVPLAAVTRVRAGRAGAFCVETSQRAFRFDAGDAGAAARWVSGIAEGRGGDVRGEGLGLST